MLTQKRLKEVLSYDPNTGIFKWLRRTNNNMRKDLVAGGDPAKSRYIYIVVDGRWYLAHRLAWLYVCGEFPEKEIDHINGDKIDNRICNLREASSSQNQYNSAKYKNNKSGYKGVSLNKDGSWHAHIASNKRQKNLGNFTDKEKAAHAYDVAALKLHGKFAKTNFDWQEF